MYRFFFKYFCSIIKNFRYFKKFYIFFTYIYIHILLIFVFLKCFLIEQLFYCKNTIFESLSVQRFQFHEKSLNSQIIIPFINMNFSLNIFMEFQEKCLQFYPIYFSKFNIIFIKGFNTKSILYKICSGFKKFTKKVCGIKIPKRLK